MRECGNAEMRYAINLRAATGQWACGFVVKVPRVGGLASEAKKLTVEDRNFSFIDRRPLPRAFHTKARSHFPITTLCEFFWDGLAGCAAYLLRVW
jgi:hypothetical protein